MKKLITFTCAILGMSLVSVPASAGTINFADFAAGNEGGIAEKSEVTFSSGDTILFWPGYGLDLDASWDELGFFPYFDDVSGGKPAGLGVCRVLNGAAGIGVTGAECLNSGDDSIDGESGVNEFIGLTINFYSGGFDLRSLSFRDGEHNDINGSLGTLRVVWHAVGADEMSSMDMTFALAVAMASIGAFGTIDYIGFGYLDTRFYIESISDVPIPGAIPILLSGLAGLGFASRKRKRS